MQRSRSRIHRARQVDANPVAAKGAGRAPTQIGDHNLRVTLEAIRRDGPLTRLELVSRTGLTAPGLTNILRRLGADGLVTSHRRHGSRGGQTSTEFALDPDGAFSIGVRLHGCFCEAVLVDLVGMVRDRIVLEMPDGPGLALQEAVNRLCNSTIRPRRLLGVGIAHAVPTDLDREELSSALHPLSVSLERDCVTAVLAERTLGSGVPDGGLVLIVIDDSVRAGLLLQGVPFGGVHGRAGSIGAMRTGADHVPLDSIVGLGALRARLSPDELALLDAGADLPLSVGVTDWIKGAAGHLLDAIAAMAGFIAPGAILIGGDLPRNVVEALIQQVSVERRDTNVRPSSTPWISPIAPASFGGAGIAIGAALLPFFETLLPSPTATA